LQLENNRFHVKDFYEELRIFNKNHVAVRRIANSRISFNRSAFAARVVTKREAIERIYHALVEEAKLPMQQWPDDMKFTEADRVNLDQPICTLPESYEEGVVRGGRRQAAPVIDDKQPEVEGAIVPAHPPLRPAAAARSDVKGMPVRAAPAVRAAAQQVVPAARIQQEAKVPQAGGELKLVELPKRIGRQKTLLLEDGVDVMQFPELKVDPSHAIRYVHLT
jgi:hypothetical protein